MPHHMESNFKVRNFIQKNTYMVWLWSYQNDFNVQLKGSHVTWL